MISARGIESIIGANSSIFLGTSWPLAERRGGVAGPARYLRTVLRSSPALRAISDRLITELPAAVLARTLGIDITVAVKWQRAAAGEWGAYAAEVSRRTSSQRI